MVVLPQWVDPLRPVVGQDQAARIRVVEELHPQQVHDLALDEHGAGQELADRLELARRLVGPRADGDHNVERVEAVVVAHVDPVAAVASRGRGEAPALGDHVAVDLQALVGLDVDVQALGIALEDLGQLVGEVGLDLLDELLSVHGDEP